MRCIIWTLMGGGVEQSFCSRWSEIKKGCLRILRVLRILKRANGIGSLRRGHGDVEGGLPGGCGCPQTVLRPVFKQLAGSSKWDLWTGCRVDSITFKQTALSRFREVGMKTGGSDFAERSRLVSPSLWIGCVVRDPYPPVCIVTDADWVTPLCPPPPNPPIHTLSHTHFMLQPPVTRRSGTYSS